MRIVQWDILQIRMYPCLWIYRRWEPAKTHLNSDLWEVNFERQLLSAVHVRVVWLLERPLQLVKLVRGKRGPVAAVLLLVAAPFLPTAARRIGPSSVGDDVVFQGRFSASEGGDARLGLHWFQIGTPGRTSNACRCCTIKRVNKSLDCHKIYPKQSCCSYCQFFFSTKRTLTIKAKSWHGPSGIEKRGLYSPIISIEHEQRGFFFIV